MPVVIGHFVYNLQNHFCGRVFLIKLCIRVLFQYHFLHFHVYLLFLSIKKKIEGPCTPKPDKENYFETAHDRVKGSQKPEKSATTDTPQSLRSVNDGPMYQKALSFSNWRKI